MIFLFFSARQKDMKNYSCNGSPCSTATHSKVGGWTGLNWILLRKLVLQVPCGANKMIVHIIVHIINESLTTIKGKLADCPAMSFVFVC